jgi:DNA-binding transcriptional LysR family regulator
MDLLAQMRTFVGVVDGKSLSTAARAQRLSLPAVSRQLRALETELGVELIARSTRRLRVTDAGQRWYDHSVRILRDVDDARSAIRSNDRARGTLVVSASFAFGTHVIVPRLAKMVERHPELGIDVRLEDHLVDLVGEGVDIAVRAGSPPPDSTAFVAHPILTMHRIVVASPRWLKEHGRPRTPKQLPRSKCLVQVTLRGAIVPWALRREAADEIVAVDGRVRSHTPIVLLDFARAGLGMTYVPEFLVADDLQSGRLERVLPGWASPPISAWAIHRRELRGSPKVQAFLDAMSESSARATVTTSRS